MKRSSTTVAILAGMLLTSAVSAQASPTWTAYGTVDLSNSMPYADIQSVSVTSNTDTKTWDFTMQLSGNPTTAPVGGLTYSIFFGSMGGDPLFSKSEYQVDANSTKLSRGKISLFYTGTEGTTGGDLSPVSTGHSGTSLFWSVKKSDISLGSFYFAGQSALSSDNSFKERTSVAATPIPGAALLLGSGLVGLLGLNRRKKMAA